MVYAAVIRNRGQLTIPDKVRALVDWLSVGEVVDIEVTQEEIKVKPYSGVKTKAVDWKGFLRKIELARSFRGKRGNLSGMIVQDRESH